MPEDANLQLPPIELDELLARDFRSERMDTIEGAGRARQHLDGFYEHGEGADLARELNRAQGRFSYGDPEEYEPELDYANAEAYAASREETAKAALEEADLIGFWVAWHRAGGFRGLEKAGWHRTTIHRRVKRFRMRFGAHPDEMAFSWITLNLGRCWREEYERLIRQAHSNSEPPWDD